MKTTDDFFEGRDPHSKTVQKRYVKSQGAHVLKQLQTANKIIEKAMSIVGPLAKILRDDLDDRLAAKIVLTSWKHLSEATGGVSDMARRTETRHK